MSSKSQALFAAKIESEQDYFGPFGKSQFWDVDAGSWKDAVVCSWIQI